MKGARALVILTVLAIAVSSAVPASAPCVSGVSLCQAFWGYEAVFEGTVVSIDQKAASDSASPFQSMPERFRPPFRIITFDVLRSSRGPEGPRITLTLAGGSGVWVEDSVDYALGGRYLVFAYRVPADGNILSTSTCAPGSSLRRSDTSEERAFLQSLSLPSSGGRGFGGVYDETTFVPGQRRQPSVEARLTLTGEGINRTETSIKGTFSFNDLEPRAYVLSIDVPSGFEAWAPATVTVPDPHACVDRSYVLHRTGG